MLPRNNKGMSVVLVVLVAVAVVLFVGAIAPKAEAGTPKNVQAARYLAGAVSTANPIEIGSSQTKYTVAFFPEAGSEYLGFFFNPSTIASGGTLTVGLQTGFQDADGNWQWFDYVQLSAADKGNYSTAAAADQLMYQRNMLTYSMPAASKAAKFLRFEGWEPAYAVRAKFSMDGSHASTVPVAYWQCGH